MEWEFSACRLHMRFGFIIINAWACVQLEHFNFTICNSNHWESTAAHLELCSIKIKRIFTIESVSIRLIWMSITTHLTSFSNAVSRFFFYILTFRHSASTIKETNHTSHKWKRKEEKFDEEKAFYLIWDLSVFFFPVFDFYVIDAQMCNAAQCANENRFEWKEKREVQLHIIASSGFTKHIIIFRLLFLVTIIQS